ncbi:MAG: alanine racemase, partial [Actinobacteria bacterium]|nr:alanine racemase [Actinomycetota bacterium]
MPRHAAIEVDLSAITANTQAILEASSGAEVCAVVKADGYGHGAVQVATAALAGGATWLAVALVEEGSVLRQAGIQAPILLLSEPPADAMKDALAVGLTPTLYTPEGVAAARQAVSDATTRPSAWSVHLKVDTGMHRVGAHPSDAIELARSIHASSELQIGGTFTHFAVADDLERSETAAQLELFELFLEQLNAEQIDCGLVHAANSAGVLGHLRAHRDLVRSGIAIYGLAPSVQLDSVAKLRPALRLQAEVSMVKAVEANRGVSYGLQHVFSEDAVIAIVPLGYADGVDRRLGLVGAQVLIGGVRRPMRGVVTMDQLIVEVTHGPKVRVGDEVVLIGTQGD